MTENEFLRRIANGKADIVRLMLDILARTGSPYCVIGGLAVNAYTEPVVSLDLGVVIVAAQTGAVCAAAADAGLTVERFAHSINLASSQSDLRVQIQVDPRYQEFIARATPREVLGYTMSVARAEDVLAGKIWAFRDSARRPSKRQKDLADIMRLTETNPSLAAHLPPDIRERMI